MELYCTCDPLDQPVNQPEPLPCAMSIQEELARCSYRSHAYRPDRLQQIPHLNQSLLPIRAACKIRRLLPQCLIVVAQRQTAVRTPSPLRASLNEKLSPLLIPPNERLRCTFRSPGGPCGRSHRMPVSPGPSTPRPSNRSSLIHGSISQFNGLKNNGYAMQQPS